MATVSTTTATADISADPVADREHESIIVPAGPEGHKSHISTLGHLRLRDEETNQIILIPNPSVDPKDPLNWNVYHGPIITERQC